MSALPVSGCDQETAWGWLFAVPLPYQGIRCTTCGTCGQRFKGRPRKRRYAYEAHWVLAHSPLQQLLAMVQTREQPELRMHMDVRELWDLQASTGRCMRELLRLVAMLRAAGAPV